MLSPVGSFARRRGQDHPRRQGGRCSLPFSRTEFPACQRHRLFIRFLDVWLPPSCASCGHLLSFTWSKGLEVGLPGRREGRREFMRDCAGFRGGGGGVRPSTGFLQPPPPGSRPLLAAALQASKAAPAFRGTFRSSSTARPCSPAYLPAHLWLPSTPAAVEAQTEHVTSSFCTNCPFCRSMCPSIAFPGQPPCF